MDKSQNDDPKETIEEESIAGFFSIREAWHRVVQQIQAYDYLIKPDLEGRYCGNAVFKRSEYLKIPHVTPNKDFWYWRQISTEDEDFAFFKAFKETIIDLVSGSSDKSEIKALMLIGTCMLDEPANPKSKVYSLVANKLSDLSGASSGRPVTLNGTTGAFKVLPKLEWFPASVQSLDARELLTLYPDAEARQMMLLLGRAVVGANNTQALEGTIYHTSRSYGITVGTEPGLGKSTLHNYIIEAMDALGYKTTCVQLNDTKFGWGVIARSDLAYLDDLTSKVQERLMGDIKVKTIVSNGTLAVEEKGLPHYSVRATTVILGCTNLYDPSHYIGMDSGSTSRVNQMDTYTKGELDRRWVGIDGRTMPQWERLAEEHKVTTGTLAAYLLRRCADDFLEVTGYTWDDGRLFKDKEDRLEEVTKANRLEFRLDTSLKHMEELVTSVAHLVALAIAKSDEVDSKVYLELLEYIDFSPALLLAQLRLFSATRLSNPLPEAYKLLGLPSASWDCKGYITKKLGDLDRIGEVKNSAGAFEVVVRELRSNKGFGYPTKVAGYTPYWLAFRRQIPDYVLGYRDSVKTAPLPQALRVAVAEIQSIFTGLQ